MTSSTRSCVCIVAVLLARPAAAQDLELKVTLVSPSAVIDSAVVTVAGGRIASVSSGAGSAKAVAIDGVMFPGLIDLHNHMTWNVLPNWQPPHLFANRYEWQETAEYAQRIRGALDRVLD